MRESLIDEFIAYLTRRGIDAKYHDLYRAEAMVIVAQSRLSKLDQLDPAILAQAVREAERQLQNRRAVCVALEAFLRNDQDRASSPGLPPPRTSSPGIAPSTAPPAHSSAPPPHSSAPPPHSSAPPPPYTPPQPFAPADLTPAAPPATQVTVASKGAKRGQASNRRHTLPMDKGRRAPAAIPTPAGSEHRKYVRIPFTRRVEVKGSLADNRCSDLSVGGMYLETMQAAELGTVLEISFRLRPKDPHPMRVLARVVYSDPGVGAGLDFIDLPAGVHRAIHRYVVETVRRSGRGQG